MSVGSNLDIKALNANKNIVARDYWRDRLADLELHAYFDDAQNALASDNVDSYAQYELKAPDQTTVALKGLAASDKARHIVLLSALGIFAHKCSSASDVVVFSPVYSGAADNSLVPVRMNSFSGISYTAFLTSLKDDFIKDLRHGNYPLDKILVGLDGYSTIGLFVEEVQDEKAFQALRPEILFRFSVRDGLHLTIKYDAGKFGHAYIAQLARLYFHLLSELISKRENDLNEIELVPLAEKHQIIFEFNNTQKPFPQHKTILDLFDSQVRQHPGNIAVQFRGDQLSYAELDIRSNQAAHYLAKNGVSKGAIVGVKLDRSLELMIAVFGILKAGCVYLPLTRDYPAERVRYVLSNSNANVLFASAGDNAELSTAFKCVDLSETQSYSCEYINLATADDLAYVIYTSGSTGHPKGVMIRHRSVVNRLNWMQNEYQLTASDIILQKTPIVFDVSVWELFWWCFTGAKLVLAEPGAEKDPGALCKIIDAEKITVLHFVPAMLNVLVNHLEENRQKYSLGSIRHVFASGEELNASYAQTFLSFCPQAQLHNLYGPTEATVDVSYHQVSPTASYKRIPIGKPIDNTTLLIFNKEGQLQPVGIPGELFIGGVNLSAGYLNQQELTTERFVKSPLNETETLYKTGDLARWLPDGSIEFLGRIDNQVKIRGNRIEIGEIAHAIKSFHSIKDVVVLTKGAASSLQLGGFIVTQQGFDEEQLRAFLLSRLPEYMVPSYFISINEVPVTVNGKVDRKKLLSLKMPVNDNYVAPSTLLEKALAAQWANVLEVQQIGLHDSFFRIGGDSILAVRLIGAINNQLSINLVMINIYENETIAKLAAFIQASSFEDFTQEYKKIEQELEQFNNAYVVKANNNQVEHVYPMSDIEKAMCFIHKSRPEDILYFEQIMQPVAYEKLDIAMLQQALDLLVQKHAILRTGFDLNDFAHIVYKNIESKIIFHDYTAFSAGQQKTMVQANLEKSRQEHFDLDTVPLWRLIVYKLKEGHHEILFEYHHAIIDGWSIASLITELNNTYVDILEGRVPDIQPLECDYKDYITEELFHKQNQQTINYWKNELKDFKKLKLNSAPGPKVFKSVRETYPAKLVADLETAAAQMDTTVKNILLASHINAMRTLSCETDVLIGLVTFTRPLKKDGDKLLGCFLKTVPFRVKLPEEITWRQLVKLIDNKLLEIKKYEHLSLFEINQAIGARTHEGNPLFDTQFNFINFHVEDGLQLQKMSDEEMDRLEFDSFLRGNTFFDLNYNVNKERILCMHEYSSPYMNEETFAHYAGIFNAGIAKIMEAPEESTGPDDNFWKSRTEAVNAELKNYTHDIVSSKELIPASCHQERLWLDEFEPRHVNKKAPAHNIPLIIEMEGIIDFVLLEKSIALVIKRHEALRTQLINVNDRPYQRIKKEVEFRLRFENAQQRVVKTTEMINTEINQPFEADRSLVRAALLHIAKGEYKLVITLHNLVADRYSAKLLATEIMSAYGMLLHGKQPEENPVVLDYAGFSLWQHASVTKLNQRLLSFWKQHAGNDPEPLELPTDKPRAAAIVYSAACHDLSIPKTLVKKLLTYEKRTGISARIVLMAAFKVLLYKYSRQEELVIGTVANNRINELKGLIGPVSNLMPLRTSVAGNTFNDYVVTLNLLYNDALKHQQLPFELLAKELGAGKDRSRNLLFDVLFQYDDEQPQFPSIDGLKISLADNNLGFGKYDLNLLLQRSNDCFTGKLVFNAEYFTQCTIASFVKHYCNILNAVLLAPDSQLSTIEIITKEEKQQVLQQFNDTKADYPKHETIISLFDQQVARTPANTAIIYGDEKLTYLQLQEESCKLAAYLQTVAGIKTGQLVGIMLEREEYLMPSIFGILRAGAAYVPIDPNYPVERINAIITDAGLKAVITRKKHLNAAMTTSPVIIELDEAAASISQQPANGTTSNATGDDLAYVIYTSGSTGKPKGVMIRHHSVINSIAWFHKACSITQSDVQVLKTPIVFDVSVWELFGWAFAGASLCLLKPGEEKEPSKIIAAIAKNNVSVIHFVPSVLAVFLAALDNGFDFTQLNSVRQVICSGEALKPEHVVAFGGSLHMHCGTRLMNLYGPTETTVHVSGSECRFKEHPIITIGKPIDNTHFYVLDPTGQLLPAGVPGELCIGGAPVAKGYLNNAELTAEKFIDDPYLPGEKIYRSGDLVKWLPDGDLAFLGRIDHQVKIRGFRVELGEIESQLSQYAGVKESVVMVKEREGDKYLVAYYVSAAELGEAVLQQHLSAKLPEYMVPGYYVHLQSLPVTSNGKLDRKALPDPVLKTGGKYVAPSNEMEEKLVKIWAEVLKVDRDLISVNRSFFELGGHSLKATMLINKIEKSLNTAITIKDIFDRPTVRQQGEFIRVSKWLNNDMQVENTEKIEVII